MCGLLDKYLLEFSTLRGEKDTNRWSELSLTQSPAKPFLLLSILDQIAAGEIVRNFISPTANLVAAYENYMSLLPGDSAKVPLYSPFYHLRDSSFWLLKPKEDKFEEPSSLDQLRDDYFGAEIRKELFVLLQMPPHRKKLCQCLINSHFAPRFQQVLNGYS